ncbi:glycosyltransferase involved in cell wall biosynthesis [Rhizobium sp. BK049]|uniref:glycosyltransferase family 2 protein n=1 Tax=Rhizobium sp. BK049 TaxID=2587095 RepID=UPI0016119875|nr:glycosyltransferase family 2 protein [Rhizobium sp. BK049]MBB3351025.1 glycosyltransferase involved in cell wall biosynthesis [Rhizobium sp. BK049]
MTPLISVVIPTFNRGHLVLDSLSTVLNQTYRNIEVLVVDDHSTDNTIEVLKAVSDERVRVLPLPQNGGGSVARNRGIEAAKGEYIAFLDSDDGWVAEKLEVQLKHLMSVNDPSVLAYTNLILDDGVRPRPLINKPFGRSQNVLEYLFMNWSEAYIQTSSWLMATDIARAVRFDETLRLHQDWDFLIRAEIMGFRFLAIEEPLTIWKIDVRKDRISLATDRLERSMGWLAKWENHIGARGVKAFKARRAPELASKNLMKSLLWILQGLLARSISPRPSLRQARRCVVRKFSALTG